MPDATCRGAHWAVRSVLIAAAVAAVLYLLLDELATIFVVVFSAVLLSIALSAGARLFEARAALPHKVALSLVLALLSGLIVGVIVWVGPQLAAQLGDLGEQVKRGFSEAENWLESTQAGQRLQSWLPNLDPLSAKGLSMWSEAQAILTQGIGVLAYVLALVFLGVFLAASPERYEGGLLCLVPPTRRTQTAKFLAASAHALRLWLLARLLMMTLVGVAFGVGLWLLGIPLALPLAVLAGLLDFIPYVGPTIALIPAAIVALLISPQSALYVVLLYLVVQIIESYVAQPLIEARAVSLPPALILLSQLICSVWLGAVGLLIATPLLLTVVIAIQVFYQQGVLGQSKKRLAGQ